MKMEAIFPSETVLTSSASNSCSELRTRSASAIRAEISNFIDCFIFCFVKHCLLNWGEKKDNFNLNSTEQESGKVGVDGY
jgi:hypothetical protein